MDVNCRNKLIRKVERLSLLLLIFLLYTTFAIEVNASSYITRTSKETNLIENYNLKYTSSIISNNPENPSHPSIKIHSDNPFNSRNSIKKVFAEYEAIAANTSSEFESQKTSNFEYTTLFPFDDVITVSNDEVPVCTDNTINEEVQTIDNSVDMTLTEDTSFSINTSSSVDEQNLSPEIAEDNEVSVEETQTTSDSINDEITEGTPNEIVVEKSLDVSIPEESLDKSISEDSPDDDTIEESFEESVIEESPVESIPEESLNESTTEESFDEGIDEIIDTENTSSDEEGLYPGIEIANTAQSVSDKLNEFEISASTDMSEILDLTYEEVSFIMTYSLRSNGSETMIQDLSYVDVVSEGIEESEENVNELLTLSIIYWETSRFSSNLLKSKNNFGGCTAKSGNYMSFDTPEEGIDYQIKCIKKNMANGPTVEEIRTTYCPASSDWDDNVLIIMKQFKEAALNAANMVLEN